MAFNYEQSIWGRGVASLSWSSPTSFRLRQALKALSGIKSPRILEVGCGAGQFIRAIKKIRPEVEAHGCDISSRALEIARESQGGVIYSLSGDKLPYADGSFDAVLIFDVLEHVADVPGLLHEIRRVLKSGGVFYCFVPCEGDCLSLWRYLGKLDRFKNLTEKYAGHIHHLSRREWRKMLEESGFKIIRTRYSEHFLGQLVGAVSFALMDRRTNAGGLSQINNETYFEQLKKESPGGVLPAAGKLVNTLIYLESAVLSRVPSPNLHLTLKKG